MERMLKRVGLQHRARKAPPPDDDAKSGSDHSPQADLQLCDLLSLRASCVLASDPSGEEQVAVRRPRSRLRVFNIDAHIMEFRPRALTRRFCGGKKHDNELYRSNSFKFERFERVDEPAALQKQVSLCDEYSLPVDFVNKRRPHSFGAGLANWKTPSPSGEQVEIVEAYSDPRDSKAYLEPGEEASGKVYTSPDRDYSQPYTDGSNEGCSVEEEEEEDDGVYEAVGAPDECVTVIRVGDADVDTDSLEEAPRRNPSPYYYADLFRDAPPPPRKSASLDAPDRLPPRHAPTPLLDALLMPPHRQVRAQQLSVCACVPATRCVREEDDEFDEDVVENPPPQRPHRRHHHHHHHRHHHHHHHRRQHRRHCDHHPPVEEPPVDYDDPDDDGCDDMGGRQLHLYETAFDCKISRSDDDLDDVDRVTNHPILHMKPASASSRAVRPSTSKDPSTLGIHLPNDRRKVTLHRSKQLKERPKSIPSRHHREDIDSSSTTLSQNLSSLELKDEEGEKEEATHSLALRGFSPSPPSTAPLPAKFPGNKEIVSMNSIRSAPNLPSSSPGHPRLKDLRLPIKSLRAREIHCEDNILEIKSRPDDPHDYNICSQTFLQSGRPVIDFKGRQHIETGVILEFKGRPISVPAEIEFHMRPRSVLLEPGPIQEFKGRPGFRRPGIRPKYSSTESMATSSSGGSLESIRSSTSEGNRSTTSSESHRSSSLSSHSSDSGSTGSTSGNLHHLHHHFYHHQCSTAGTPLVTSGSRFFAHQSSKLHILSPISDKSSQEPVSETSDNNKNNNSQKASPEDTEQITSPSTVTLPLEQPPWLESLGAKVKRRAPQNKNLINLSLQQQSSGETEIQGSDSGISIESRGGTKMCKSYCFLNQNENGQEEQAPPADFSDLPFDMPKLRRRKQQVQDTCTSGSATSVDLDGLPFDMPKLRRRLRGPQLPLQDNMTSTESSGVSQASSSQSVQEVDKGSAPGRPSLTLNLSGAGPRQRMGLCLNLGNPVSSNSAIDITLPLERQGWYHGAITRIEAENVLRLQQEGSYLVRNSESTRQDYSLSLKSARGFMHMRIQQNKENGKYILGQFSKPFDNIPEMIQHYTVNRLPIRGAEHMCLLHPVIEQLL